MPPGSAAWTTRIERVDEVVGNIVACILDGAIACAYRAGDVPATAALLDRARSVVGETTCTMDAVSRLLELRRAVETQLGVGNPPAGIAREHLARSQR